LNLCENSPIPMKLVDTIYVDDKELMVKYNSVNCESKETIKINIENIEN